MVRIELTEDDSLAAMRARNKFGMAMAAMMRMIATTISNSINEKPFCFRISCPFSTYFKDFVLVSQPLAFPVPFFIRDEPLYTNDLGRLGSKKSDQADRICRKTRQRREIRFYHFYHIYSHVNECNGDVSSIDQLLHGFQVADYSSRTSSGIIPRWPQLQLPTRSRRAERSGN